MESHQEKSTARWGVVHGDGWVKTYLLDPITTISPATPSTPNTTPSLMQGTGAVKGQFSMSPTYLASSAPTSSNTQRSEGSLSYIEVALEELTVTLASKNQDYRIDGELSNFEFAAEAAGIETYRAILSQLAIKLGRLKGIEGKDVNNETALDTYKDLAGYAIILYAYALSLQD